MTTTETTTEHFHIDASAEGPECCSDIFSALESADFYIDGQADFEHDGISAMGDADDFEGAYRAFQRSEELSALLLNVRNITDHHYERKQPAPLYSGFDAAELLHEAAKRIVQMVNDSCANVTIYEHALTDECEPEDADD